MKILQDASLWVLWTFEIGERALWLVRIISFLLFSMQYLAGDVDGQQCGSDTAKQSSICYRWFSLSLFSILCSYGLQLGRKPACVQIVGSRYENWETWNISKTAWEYRSKRARHQRKEIHYCLFRNFFAKYRYWKRESSTCFGEFQSGHEIVGSSHYHWHGVLHWKTDFPKTNQCRHTYRDWSGHGMLWWYDVFRFWILLYLHVRYFSGLESCGVWRNAHRGTQVASSRSLGTHGTISNDTMHIFGLRDWRN